MLEEHNQGELPKGGKHLLPPVRLYARKHVSNSTMQKILNFAKDKKHQLQQQIHQQEYNPLEVDLKYLQSGPFDEIKTQVKSYSNPAIEEEMLARGSIDEWVETEPSKKSRLFTKDFHLESTHIDVTRSRIRSALRDEGSDNPLAYKRYKKCATEPPQHESTPVRRKIQTRNQKRYDYTGRTIEEDQKDELEGNQESRIVVYQSKKQRSLQSNRQTPKVYPKQEQNQFLTVPKNKKSKARSTIQIHQYSRPSATKNSLRLRTSSVHDQYEGMVAQDHSPRLMKFYQAIYILKKSAKTNQRLERAVSALQGINSLFKRIQRVIGVCLLRIGKVMHKYPQSVLYQRDLPYTYFYILLSGRVKLIGRDKMYKICETGETLLQELIFDCPPNGQDPVALQKAKVQEESWVLRIELSQLGKLQRELVKYGFKQGLVQLKNLIKRNQIVKNWVRNKFKLLSNQ